MLAGANFDAKQLSKHWWGFPTVALLPSPYRRAALLRPETAAASPLSVACAQPVPCKWHARPLMGGAELHLLQNNCLLCMFMPEGHMLELCSPSCDPHCTIQCQDSQKAADAMVSAAIFAPCVFHPRPRLPSAFRVPLALWETCRCLDLRWSKPALLLSSLAGSI